MDLDKISKYVKIAAMVFGFAFSWATIKAELLVIKSLLVEAREEQKQFRESIIENTKNIAILEERTSRER